MRDNVTLNGECQHVEALQLRVQELHDLKSFQFQSIRDFAQSSYVFLQTAHLNFPFLQ